MEAGRKQIDASLTRVPPTCTISSGRRAGGRDLSYNCDPSGKVSPYVEADHHDRHQRLLWRKTPCPCSGLDLCLAAQGTRMVPGLSAYGSTLKLLTQPSSLVKVPLEEASHPPTSAGIS